MNPSIYLDYNATTPHDPQVIEAMRPFIEEAFGNPSSGHLYGIGPKQAVEHARKQIASLLNCHAKNILFTSGGTESNNHAIKGVAYAYQEKGNHIITSQIEHPAVLEVCRFLDKHGFETTYLPVDEYGQVRLTDLEKAIKPQTILISIMHANNEVGTIQPIKEIGEIAKKHDIVFHTDAAQSVGKIPTDVNDLGVDLLTIAGHKVYAPKGIGALFIKDNVHLEKFCHGAGQESGRRAGTENVVQIVGLGKACEISQKYLAQNMAHMQQLRDVLEQTLTSRIQNARVNGHPVQRLPNTLSISFKDLEANRILEEIGLEIAASAGAACHSDQVEVSHVLSAMQVPLDWAKGTLRLSAGRMTVDKDIEKAIEVIENAVEGLRKGGVNLS